MDLENTINTILSDSDAELLMLIGMMEKDTIPYSLSKMKKHFECVKKGNKHYVNHDCVLSVSIGGSNTKVMLSHMKNNTIVIDYLTSRYNPSSDISFYSFLDDILYSDEAVADYLKSTLHPCISFSIPMIIKEGCPYHPTKVPHIFGFIARRKEEICPENAFEKIIKQYFSEHGIKDFTLFYQSDGIIAQIGAVSISQEFNDFDKKKTILCVDGTGMATADEYRYMPLSIICCLPDCELFPHALTEGGELNYAVSGKGLFALFARAVCTLPIISDEVKHEVSTRWFSSAKDTKRVFEVYQSKIDPDFKSDFVESIRQIAGDRTFMILQQIASAIVERVASSLANCIIATAYSLNPEREEELILYLEGSIAKNPYVEQKMLSKIQEKLQGSTLSTYDNLSSIRITYSCSSREIVCIDERSRSIIDNTILGAAVAVIAEDAIRKE